MLTGGKKPEEGARVDKAIEMAETLAAGGVKPGEDGVGAADGDIDPDYFDYVKDQQAHMKEARRSGDAPEPNAPVNMPAAFDAVSVCAKGPCKWLFELVAPVRVRVIENKNTGAQRSMMATIRRCLIGAVKLDSEDPAAMSVMKGLGTEAPYGAQRCSSWTPMTAAELALRDARILEYQDREDENKKADAALAEHRRLAAIASGAPAEQATMAMAARPELAAAQAAYDGHALTCEAGCVIESYVTGCSDGKRLWDAAYPPVPAPASDVSVEDPGAGMDDAAPDSAPAAASSGEPATPVPVSEHAAVAVDTLSVDAVAAAAPPSPPMPVPEHVSVPLPQAEGGE